MTEIKLIRDDDKATKILAAVAQIDAGVELAPVVRCKDCKHFVDAKGKDGGKPCGYGQCTSVSGLSWIICADDFCSGGERRTNDGEI